MARSVIALGAALAVCVPAAAGASPSETVLYSFTGGNDGRNPYAAPVFGSAGELYSATESYGTYNETGTVYKLTPPASGQLRWTETVLHRFPGGAAGDYPEGGVVLGSDGALYGTTYYGGAKGFGTVFRLAPPTATQPSWAESVLYSFKGGADGANPHAGVVLDGKGVLYGTTYLGGSAGAGTVFMVTPPAGGRGWTESVLHSFANGTDGGTPRGGVILGSGGVLYGTTELGGSGAGVAFALAPPVSGTGGWTESVLHSFAGGSDGAEPYAGLVKDGKGMLYGTTAMGGAAGDGTVFRLAPPPAGKSAWTKTLLHAFKGTSDGEAPIASLALDGQGALYGTTYLGGKSNLGVVFKLTPPATGATWPFTVLHSFAGGSDGANPPAGVAIDAKDVVYGATRNGGAADAGVVFKVTQ